MTFAATVFAHKLGLSLGGAISGWLLDSYGYIANAPQQTEQALNGICLMMSILPALAFGIAVATLAFYQIGRSEEVQMGQELQARRETYSTE